MRGCDLEREYFSLILDGRSWLSVDTHTLYKAYLKIFSFFLQWRHGRTWSNKSSAICINLLTKQVNLEHCITLMICLGTEVSLTSLLHKFSRWNKTHLSSADNCLQFQVIPLMKHWKTFAYIFSSFCYCQHYQQPFCLVSFEE